jgi:hypothetical protein
MSALRRVLLACALLSSSALAAEPGPAAAQAARQTMRDAMLKQAAMPTHPPVMPMTKPDGTGPGPVRPPPPRDRSDAAQKKAMGSGVQDAGAVRAEMANRAANGGAMGTMRQTTGDMMNAPMMQRSQGMDPGGGMMPGGGSGGGGMGPGGMGPGGMGPGGPGGMMPGGMTQPAPGTTPSPTGGR